MKPNKILFLTLYTFSLTGGIEKVCRAICKVFSLLQTEGTIKNFSTLSLHDHGAADEHYVSQRNFKGFNGFKIGFVFAVVIKTFNADIIVLSHINLLVFGLLIKKIAPKTRIILMAHGIEVWETLPRWKVKFLQQDTEICAVSKFTAKQLTKLHQIDEGKITVVNNCLDPFFELPINFTKPAHLQIRYGLTEHDKVIYSLTRLSSAEQYKGYDKVLEAVHRMPKNVKYILAGKPDKEEKLRVLSLIEKFGLKDQVFLAGFVLESELSDYYLLADVFAMPSSGEGFGISFIEAAACGCPSIAGNVDGSRDALLNGTLGKLVDPNDVEEIRNAIAETLEQNNRHSSPTLQENCIENFGFASYKEKVFALLN